MAFADTIFRIARLATGFCAFSPSDKRQIRVSVTEQFYVVHAAKFFFSKSPLLQINFPEFGLDRFGSSPPFIQITIRQDNRIGCYLLQAPVKLKAVLAVSLYFGKICATHSKEIGD